MMSLCPHSWNTFSDTHYHSWNVSMLLPLSLSLLYYCNNNHHNHHHGIMLNLGFLTRALARLRCHRTAKSDNTKDTYLLSHTVEHFMCRLTVLLIQRKCRCGQATKMDLFKFKIKGRSIFSWFVLALWYYLSYGKWL